MPTTPPYELLSTPFLPYMNSHPGEFDVIFIDTATIFSEPWVRSLLAGISVCAKEQAHAYIFCKFPEVSTVIAAIAGSFGKGWVAFPFPMIHHHIDSGETPWPHIGPRLSYDTIVYACRGGRHTRQLYSDVITTRKDQPGKFPVALYQNLLQRSVWVGDRILAVPADRGNVFSAAAPLQCSVVGLEDNIDNHRACLERIEALTEARDNPDPLARQLAKQGVKTWKS